MKTWQKVGLGIISFVVVAFIGAFVYMSNILRILDRTALVSENVKETIPFYYSQSRHILVNVRINGSKNKYPFILDSGATTYVFKNLLEQHQLPDIGNGFAIGAGGGMFFPDILQINQLTLGNIEFKNVSAESIDKLPISCSEGVFGILGKEAMQHLVWQIDFKKEEILVVSNKEQLTFGAEVDSIPLKENPFGHQLYVNTIIGLDSQRVKFTIDLGSNDYASTNIKKMENRKGRKVEMIGNASIGLDGANKSKAIIQEVKKFQIGAIMIPDFSISASGTPMNLLGLGFLRNYRTTISWKDDQLILEPNSEQNFGRKGFGISPRFDEKVNALVIKSVCKDWQAYKLGIQPDAKVISLNGKLMDTADKYCNFSFKGIDQLEMVYEQKGAEKTAILERRDYFPKEDETEILLSKR